jgi:hypothetical protein
MDHDVTIRSSEARIKLESADMAEPSRSPSPDRDSKSPQKPGRRKKPARKIFSHLPDSTQEATSTFALLDTSIYTIKALGDAEHEGMGCDCTEEWGELPRL